MLFLHRNKFLFRIVISYIILSFLFQTFFPMGVYALTSGPSQPEFSSFEPAGTSEMVDLSTGDFNYNINLMDVSGFPINISYHGGYGSETEAGMVGLGWNLNIGQLNRNMRGLPDEFEGDPIIRTNYMKPNTTIGLNAGLGWEAAGIDLNKILSKLNVSATLGLGVFHNNYRGMGFEFSPSSNWSLSRPNGDHKTRSLNFGLMTSLNSQNGLGLSGSLGFDSEYNKNATSGKYFIESTSITKKANISAGFNSRTGLQALSLTGGYSKKQQFRGIFGTRASRTKINLNGASSISFATPSYTPQISLPFSNIGARISAAIGPAFVTQFPKVKFDAYVSSQFLSTQAQTESVPAYGYLKQYETLQKGDDRLLMDFNRHKDANYMPGVTPNLAVPQATYDVYAAVGHGLAGSYRPHHSGIYAFSDPEKINPGLDINSNNDGAQSWNLELGVEFGGGWLFHMGGNIFGSITNSKSGKWTNGNRLKDALENPLSNSIKDTYEPYYFKNLGERSVESDPEFYQNIGNEEAVYVPIEENTHRAQNLFVDSDGATYGGGQNYHRIKRAKRNQHLSFFTGREMIAMGKSDLTSYPLFYTEDQNSQNGHQVFGISGSIVNHGSDYRKEHHPAEFRAVNPDGTKYIFGLPAYNIHEIQKTFALPTATDPIDSEEKYMDWCAENQMYPYESKFAQKKATGLNGKSDKYFESIETPGYAHTYLLTDVQSSDYVDIHDDGITTDDPGTAYKVNYSRLSKKDTREEVDYQWRTPHTSKERMANFSEGVKMNLHDDKGSLVYGKREQWYVNSIESKDRIAVFFYSDREDGIGVVDEEGAMDNSVRLKQLDKIELYARDKLEGKAPGENTPIKTVHFSYDYELCPGVPNNVQEASNDKGTGKLSLKELWFTYGNSQRDRLNPYVFEYNALNPGYEPKGFDRWGTYKPTDCDADLRPWDYPYADQMLVPQGHIAENPDPDAELYEKTRFSDYYVSAWQLSKIRTPSGATVEISYESDDYAFVQDKWAHQMVKVLGMGPNNTLPTTADGKYLFDKPSGNTKYVNNNYLFLELPQAVNSAEELSEKYLKGIEKELYFNYSINATLDPDNPDMPGYERVGGFVEIDLSVPSEAYGVIATNPNTPTNQVWIKIKEASTKDNGKGAKVNHISKISWNHMRRFLSEWIYPGSSPNTTDPKFVERLFGFAVDMQSFILGPYRMMRNRGFAQKFEPKKSWVRLLNPDGFKHGGGLRVKQIKMLDNWDEMSGGLGEYYGQSYDYTQEDENSTGRIISSGVASYEPLIGDDENPFYTQKIVYAKKPIFPDEIHAIPEPILQSFFPAPSVIYSKVTVRDLVEFDDVDNKKDVEAHRRGYTESHYYTAKDFPVIAEETGIQRRSVNPDFAFLFNMFDYVSVSQGYAIKLNNMHGVAKAQWVFGEGAVDPSTGERANTRVSGVEYKYRAREEILEDGSKRQVLNNDEVPVIRRNSDNGILGKETIGREIDFVLDSRQHRSTTIGVGASGNMDVFLIPVPLPPFIVPFSTLSGFPDASFQQRRFRSLVSMKTIHHAGLLEEIIAHDGNAQVSTFNEAYDAETGEVLLTKTITEYHRDLTEEEPNATELEIEAAKDEVYTLSYPAHWAYDQMGQAYTNQGISWENLNNGNPNSGITFNNWAGAKHLVKGDKLLLKNSNGDDIVAWVLEVNYLGSKVTIIDKEGELLPVSLYTDVKILESGRKNQQAISIGSVSMKENPIPKTITSASTLTFNKVIAANAVEFSDEWQIQCGIPDTETKCACEPVSREAVDFRDLISYLITSGNLINQTVDLSNHPYYSAKLATAAIPNPTAGCSPTLVCTPQTPNNNCSVSQLIIEIGESCGGNFSATTTMTLNAPADNLYCLENLTDFFSITSDPPFSNDCQENNNLKIMGFYDFCGLGQNEMIQFTGNISGFPVRKCSTYVVPLSTAGEIGETINPFLAGMRGNFAPIETYTYLTGRSFTADIGTSTPSSPQPLMSTDLREQGVYEQFTPFWEYNTNSDTWEADKNNWRSTSTLTKRLPQGLDIESVDALGNYSSVQYGQYMRLPVAVAANARINEIAYANFEFESDFGTSSNVHANIVSNQGIDGKMAFSQDQSHTGYTSVKLRNNEILSLNTVLSDATNCIPPTPASGLSFEIDACHCAGSFKPTKGMKYRLAFWVLGESYFDPTNSAPVFGYDDLRINLGGGVVNGYEIKTGKLVEGWMPVEVIFEIPALASSGFVLELDRHNNTTEDLFIDDLMIHPFDANMQTWVYDPDTQWLLAAGDAINYYKIYQYDKSGALTSVKQESERGIITTQSATSHMANQKD